MADVCPLRIYFLVTFMMLVSHVHLLVPPKTPVLSGFEPAAIGSYRELVCDADQPGAGTITYKWYKYSKNRYTGEDWESKGPIDTGQKYIFNPVTEKHVFYQGHSPEYVRGKYKCRASNSAGTRDSEWGDLYVYKPCSLYTVSVSSPNPAVGSKFTLNCNIPNPSGATVLWMKRSDALSGANSIATANSLGCRTPPISRYSWTRCSKPSSTSRTFNVQVTNAQTSDSGYWTCGDLGLTCRSNPVKTLVQVPPGTPQITGFPSRPVVVGTQVNLKCEASPPGDTYDWYKDNTKLSTSSSYDFLVKKESAGVYKCVARNDGGSATSSEKTLTVYYKPDSVVVSSGKTSSHVGEKDKFTCTTTGGKPTPTLKIYFKRSGGTPVEVTQGQERVMTKEDNQAEYYCEATVPGYSTLTMRSDTKTYNVTYPPSGASVSTNRTTVKEGDDVTLTCEASGGNPTTYRYSWYYMHSNKEIPNETSELLTVRAVKYTQTGYRCRVVNYLPGGVVDATININILHKARWDPQFPKVVTVSRKPLETATLVLHVMVNPPPTNVTWFDQRNRLATDQGFYASKVNDKTYTLLKEALSQDDYGEYYVRVTNDVGMSVFTFQIRKKVAPNTTLTYVKRHGTTLTARWAPFHHSNWTLRINYCRLDNLDTCAYLYHVVTNQTTGETSFVIEGSAMVKSVLVLYLEVFDGPDLVFRSTPVTQSKEGGTYIWVKDGAKREVGTNVGMAVGVTVTVILVIEAVGVAIFILHRRNMACFSGSKKKESGPALSNSAANKMGTEPIYANMNPAFEAGENDGTSPGENEAQEPEYLNVTGTVKDTYAEPNDIKENAYTELNITQDVVAEQTYSDLRHTED